MSTLRSLARVLNASWQLRGSGSVGAWTRLAGRLHVRNRGQIRVGERVILYSRPAPIVLATFPDALIEVGDRTFVNYGVDICAVKLVRIGKDCLIGTHVCILDNDFHDLSARNRMPPSRPVVIGDRVCIGTRALILPGVTVGSGPVIGAGSVVTNDIPEGCLAVGNPARVIKHL
jgi:acetyltransferase-like isoleucine patch superfamily enzyme